ncbi:MAG: hypothetical protein ABIS17_06800 [Casimicrobiaceae bacterium]
MITVQRDGIRIEASAVQEPDGGCCVTAEVYAGTRMVRGYYRHLDVPPDSYQKAAREVAEELACMAGEAE